LIRILTFQNSFISSSGFDLTTVHDYTPLFKKYGGGLCFILLKKFYAICNNSQVLTGARLFFNRKEFDVIISGYIIQALTYSFLGMIFRSHRKLHLLNEIYLNEPSSVKRKIRPFLYRMFLKNVDYIRVSARREISNYSRALKVSEDRFWFNPWPSYVKDPGVKDPKGDYILSAGKQFRDYATLVRAVSGTGCRLVIVSDRKSMEGIEASQEVEVHYNISKQEYFDLLVNSGIVVVPLQNDFGSCGQISILEAMSHGKPVITARVTGSMDYIEDGISGLFYEKGNYEDLRKKIQSLYGNPGLRETIAVRSVNRINEFFTLEIFAANYKNFIDGKVAGLPLK
jgi:glycosyltransferase involved in cell wall biosynthesis